MKSGSSDPTFKSKTKVHNQVIKWCKYDNKMQSLKNFFYFIPLLKKLHLGLALVLKLAFIYISEVINWHVLI